MRFALTLIATFALVSLAVPGYAADAIGYQYGGQEYSGSNMPANLRQKLFELEEKANEERQKTIDQHILEKYMMERAAAEGKPVGQLENEVLAGTNTDESDAKKFYDDNKARIQGSFEQVKGQIIQHLNNQKIREKTFALLQRIRSEKGYSVSLPQPVQPLFDIVTEGYPFKGNPNAKVTIVEFADYQCPHCKEASKLVKNLEKDYGDKIKIVYRDFPINASGISKKVAEGAFCAKEQGKFWPYHDLAFERQELLKAVTPEMLAEELGLDAKKFKACFENQATKTKIAASLIEGRELGLSGTPTFFVNGRQLHVHGDLEQPLRKAIDLALSSSGS
ncbi:MAG: DsbA family protein [Alphaproteobacteria bacterium]|nr:DsbA family protein [Alphaproteobacteria bacterium]